MASTFDVAEASSLNLEGYSVRYSDVLTVLRFLSCVGARFLLVYVLIRGERH